MKPDLVPVVTMQNYGLFLCFHLLWNIPENARELEEESQAISFRCQWVKIKMVINLLYQHKETNLLGGPRWAGPPGGGPLNGGPRGGGPRPLSEKPPRIPPRPPRPPLGALDSLSLAYSSVISWLKYFWNRRSANNKTMERWRTPTSQQPKTLWLIQGFRVPCFTFHSHSHLCLGLQQYNLSWYDAYMYLCQYKSHDNTIQLEHHYIQLTGDVILFVLNCFEIIISIYNKPWMDEPCVLSVGSQDFVSWHLIGTVHALERMIHVHDQKHANTKQRGNFFHFNRSLCCIIALKGLGLW